ncbi:MAG: hypothetical protein ACLTEE_15305 [Anaerobutyricum hallii]
MVEEGIIDEVGGSFWKRFSGSTRRLKANAEEKTGENDDRRKLCY